MPTSGSSLFRRVSRSAIGMLLLQQHPISSRCPPSNFGQRGREATQLFLAGMLIAHRGADSHAGSFRYSFRGRALERRGQEVRRRRRARGDSPLRDRAQPPSERGRSFGRAKRLRVSTPSPSRGLGYLMVDGQSTGRIELVIAAIFAFALLGKLSDQLLQKLETRLQPWRAV